MLIATRTLISVLTDLDELKAKLTYLKELNFDVKRAPMNNLLKIKKFVREKFDILVDIIRKSILDKNFICQLAKAN